MTTQIINYTDTSKPLTIHLKNPARITMKVEETVPKKTIDRKKLVALSKPKWKYILKPESERFDLESMAGILPSDTDTSKEAYALYLQKKHG